jgi:hypothetical protein
MEGNEWLQLKLVLAHVANNVLSIGDSAKQVLGVHAIFSIDVFVDQFVDGVGEVGVEGELVFETELLVYCPT